MSFSDMIIEPCREKNDPELPPVGLFLINPGEADGAMRLAKGRNAQSHFLFNSRLSLVPETEGGNGFFVAGPAVGAPMAVMILEKLIVLGAENILVYGWCGSLSQKLRIGDVLLPTWAVSSEGTSVHYPADKRPESHGPTRKLLQKGLEKLDMAVHIGPVWSTDAPYRENIQQVAEFGEQGILGVDMEFAALAAAASFRTAKLTAVLLVSDELWSGKWKPGFRSKGFKKKSRDVLQYLFNYCAT